MIRKHTFVLVLNKHSFDNFDKTNSFIYIYICYNTTNNTVVYKEISFHILIMARHDPAITLFFMTIALHINETEKEKHVFRFFTVVCYLKSLIVCIVNKFLNVLQMDFENPI